MAFWSLRKVKFQPDYISKSRTKCALKKDSISPPPLRTIVSLKHSWTILSLVPRVYIFFFFDYGFFPVYSETGWSQFKSINFS